MSLAAARGGCCCWKLRLPAFLAGTAAPAQSYLVTLHACTSAACSPLPAVLPGCHPVLLPLPAALPPASLSTLPCIHFDYLRFSTRYQLRYQKCKLL